MFHVCLARPGLPIEYISSKLNVYAAKQEFQRLTFQAELKGTMTSVVLFSNEKELDRFDFSLLDNSEMSSS